MEAFSNQLKDDIIRACQLLKKIDANMKVRGWSRARRKQFWYDFRKNDQFREDIFEQLLKAYQGEDDANKRESQTDHRS